MPEKTLEESNATPEAEKMQLSLDSTEKAKKKGSLFGDPVFIVE